MNVIDSMYDTLAQLRDDLSDFTETLDGHPPEGELARSLLVEQRVLSRQVDYSSARCIRGLIDAGEFDPTSRNHKSALGHTMGVSRRVLNDLITAAGQLFPRAVGLGVSEPVPPRLPTLASHIAAGQAEIEAAAIIAGVLDKIPEPIQAEVTPWVEATLANLATSLTPDDLKKAALKVLQGLGLDDEPSDTARQKRRAINLSNQDTDLMSRLVGDCTPELDSLLRRLFADYAGPGDLLAEGDKAADRRTAPQRRHDALVQALKYALNRKGPMAPTRGCSTVVATMTREQLLAANGIVATDVGTLLPIRDLIRLGADRDAFLAFLDEGTGNLIELGKFKRGADIHAYLGLVAAQGVDQTPGSDLPAAMCEIHHIHPWAKGGRSTAGNMMLLGHHTHDQVDDMQQDPTKWWTITTPSGHHLLIPPVHIHPHRPACSNNHPATWFAPGHHHRHS